MTETALQRKVVAAVKGLGGKVIKIHGSRYGHAGTPDLIGCLAGRSFAVELKGKYKQPTRLQQVELDEWRAQGWATGVARSLEEFLQIVLKGERDADSGSPTD